MASLPIPQAQDQERPRSALIDHAIVAGVVLAGLASCLLLMFVLESPMFALGFGTVCLIGLGLVIVGARLRPVTRVAGDVLDRRLLHSALAEDDSAVALTDRQGRLIVSNPRYESAFAGSPTPPGLALEGEGGKRLVEAGRAAWRDGRGSAPALRAETGIFDASVERGGEREDFLVWRFSRAVTADLVSEARRLIESEGGARLGEAGVMAALVSAEGRLIAINPALRRRALGDGAAAARGGDFTALLATGEDGRIRLAREGEASGPLRLIQVPLDGAGEQPPLLFFLLDDTAGPNGSLAEGTTSASDLHALLATLPLGLALADRDGRFQFMNDAFRNAAGLGEGDRALYPGDLVVREDKAAVSNAVRRHASGASASGDVTVRLQRRADEPVALTVAGAQGLGDAAVLLSLKDNSEDEKLKRQVAQATKMQAVGQLAGGVAHDFNNILTAIIGHCDLMLMRHSPGDSDYDDIQQIKSNSNRAAGLTRQLLAFSRQQTLRPEIIQLPDIVSEVSNLLKRLMGETVRLEVNHGRNLGPVRADPGQLEQVVVNLAVNARDAMLARPDGQGGTLTIRTFAFPAAEVRAMGSEIMPVADYTALSVTDTGTGIPPEMLSKIFEPFFTTKEVGKGTGLGLSTVYGIVKQSGGFIFADSKLGEGTCFTIYLPAHRSDEEASSAAKTPRIPKEQAGELWGSGTVLIVEDEAMVRAVAERALARQGYSVLTAEDGELALETIAARDDIDLILSDVVMPTMDGPAMARRAREMRPGLPILFMSGYAEEQLRQSIDLDRVHFIPKPFSVQQLAAAVQSILSARQG